MLRKVETVPADSRNFKTSRNKTQRRLAVTGMIGLFVLLFGCKPPSPQIVFTNVPEVSPGGPDTRGTISGRVSGMSAGDRLVLLARAGKWWVQPDVHAPFTSIAPDGSWTSRIHLGEAYGALVVSPSFQPKEQISSLPSVGGDVISVATVPGASSPIDKVDHTARPLRFGGYDWRNEFRLGSLDYIHRYYLPENAETDQHGALHLRIQEIGNQRTCAQISLMQTLGYGSYRFKLVVPTQIDPAAELNIFTSNDVDRPGEHRELEFHLSRWGNPHNENAEYVVQPYHLATNVHHFELEPGPVTTLLRWSPGRAEYVSKEGSSGKEITRWSFTSGIPTYRDQRLYLNFCPFAYPKVPFSQDSEIVLEDFEYLP